MTRTRWASFLLSAVILLASGLAYHALATDSAQMDEAAMRVSQVPMTIGSWEATEEPADEASFAQTGAKTYWTRTYVHGKTKARVLVILMCGRAGKMAVHTPEVCYHGAGYELQGPPTRLDVSDSSPQHLWTARFDKRVGRPGQLRLYWGWNAHGHWEAATTPRWEFRGAAFLYKLYVSHEIASPTAAEVDPTPEFLRTFIPELHQTLFPS